MNHQRRIGIDVRMIGHSGIGTTIRGLLSGFTETQRKQIVLFTKPSGSAPVPAETVAVPYPVYGLAQHVAYPAVLEKQRLDLFHMPHFDVPLTYRKPFVATVHDLIHLLFPSHSRRPLARWYARFLMSHVAKHAGRIVAVSENTKKDFLRFFPSAENKMRVIHPGIDDRMKPPDAPRMEEILRRFGLEPGYLLYIGNLRGSKNTKGLFEAYAEYRRRAGERVPLVVAGKNFYPEYAKHGFPEGVVYLGEVDSDVLPSLYAGAAVFVFPSFYEGFGLPPLEAMACGTPVVVSNRGSLPEVCGPHAEYIDPDSPAGICDGVMRLLRDAKLSKTRKTDGLLWTKRYSWAAAAQATWNVYEEALAESGRKL